MKATINGIQVEGTVNEIIEFKKALDTQHDKIQLPKNPYSPSPSILPYTNPYTTTSSPFDFNKTITCLESLTTYN